MEQELVLLLFLPETRINIVIVVAVRHFNQQVFQCCSYFATTSFIYSLFSPYYFMDTLNEEEERERERDQSVCFYLK